MSLFSGIVWRAIKDIFGAFFGSIEKWVELKKAEQDTKLAIELGKQRLIEAEIDTSRQISLAQLGVTPRWFKIFTFMAWFMPYLVIIFFPSYGKELFDNLSIAPLWYVQTMQVLLFAVWGIAVSRDTIAGIFSNIAETWRGRSIQKQVVKEIVASASQSWSKAQLREAVKKHFNLKNDDELKRFEETIEELTGEDSIKND